jgi:4-amino-4-deoxy-L-arabinose transferase-like glycosyltransferase
MEAPAIRPGTRGLEAPLDGSRAAALLAAVAVVTAAAIRLHGLADKALWFDETVSVFFARMPADRVLAVLPANDPHPPLYYLLLHAWTGWLGSGEAAVRGLSALIGVGVVLLTWTLGRRVAGDWPALFATVLVAVAPAQVAAAQEARMYGLLALTALASWGTLWRAVGPGRGSAAAWATYAVVTAAMLYSHYYGAFVVASQVAFLAWRGSGAVEWRRAAWAGVGVAVLFAAWAPSFAAQLAGGRGWPAHRPPLTLGALPDALVAMTTGQPLLRAASVEFDVPGAAVLGLVGFAAAMVLAAYGLRDARLAPERRGLLLAGALGPLVAAFAVSLGVNVFARRYLLVITPFIALLVGAGAAALAARGGWRRAAGAAATAFLLASNVAGTVAFARQPRLDAFDWRLVARTLAAQAADGDAIVLLPGFSRIPLDYYYGGPQPRLALVPDGTDVIADDGSRLPEVVRRLAVHRRVWLLTAPPVPAAVEALASALVARGYAVARVEQVNAAALVLLEAAPR